MDSTECMQILFNCLRKVKRIHEIQEMTQNPKIKGELQLNDLNDAVDLISKKIDQYEAEELEKRKS